jgi:hypothetical protein
VGGFSLPGNNLSAMFSSFLLARLIGGLFGLTGRPDRAA